VGQETDRQEFERKAHLLEGDGILASKMAIGDDAVRADYQRDIRRLTAELRRDAEAGRITWRNAAEQATQIRNTTMVLMRSQTSAPGQAVAELLKKEGKSLNELIARYTIRIFGDSANFDTLSAADKDRIFAEIVQAAARDNPRVTMTLKWASRSGRALVFFSIAVSVYNIYTAKDHVAALEKEATTTGGGIVGGMAGGALAGLACGPGAPVCVTIGIFVGGALAAYGVEKLW
jgi:hypothetical protein